MVRSKLKGSKKDPPKKLNKDSESDEEYYVGKDRLDERKKKT